MTPTATTTMRIATPDGPSVDRLRPESRATISTATGSAITLVACGLVAILALAGATVLAALTPLRGGGQLQWDAPSQCPDATEVATLVDEHLRQQADPAPVTVDASATERAPNDWVTTVTITGTEGTSSTRTFEVASCDAAGQAVALATALAATPVPPQTPPPPPPEVPEAPAVDPEPAPDPAPVAGLEHRPEATPTPNPQPEPRRRPRGFTSAVAGITGGILPLPTALLAVESGLLGRDWHILVRGDYATPRRLDANFAPDAGGVLSMFGGAITGGPVFGFAAGPARFEVPLATGFAAGVIRARGFGTDRDATESVPYLAVTTAAGLRWVALPWLAVGVRIEVPFALLQHTFTLGAALPIAQTGAVGGRGLLTGQFRFPPRKN
jgi:hypothetical protein